MPLGTATDGPWLQLASPTLESRDTQLSAGDRHRLHVREVEVGLVVKYVKTPAPDWEGGRVFQALQS